MYDLWSTQGENTVARSPPSQGSLKSNVYGVARGKSGPTCIVVLWNCNEEVLFMFSKHVVKGSNEVEVLAILKALHIYRHFQVPTKQLILESDSLNAISCVNSIASRL